MTSNNTFTKALILFLCCFSFLAKAQDATEAPAYKHEWGLNVTGIANQFLSFNGNNAFQGPYLMTYKRLQEGRALRLGFGATVDYSDGDGGNSNVSFRQDQFGFNFRIGTEKHHEIYKRWLFTTGVDALLGANFSKFESFNNFNNGEQKNTVLLTGFGPVLGIHYRINNRISIGTESTIYLVYTHTKTDLSNGFNGFDDEDKTNNLRLDITPPFALYFSIRI